MTENCEEKDEKHISIDEIDVKNKIFDKIKSIKPYNKDIDENSSDDERNDIADQIFLPEISTVKRKEDKFYQHFLLIENGIYNGTINENFIREGLGTFSINNNEEFYSGEWKNNQYNGYGFNSKSNASTIYHGEFLNGILKEGYGKVRLENGYEYEGKIKNGKFHGLGNLSIEILGLTEMNQPNIEKSSLKLVANWNEGKTEKKFIYLNEIEEYYQYQYKDFLNSLQSLILLNRDNYKKQREFLRNLIDLYEKRFSNLNLLKEIVKHSTLPRELKFSADLLLQLDNSHTNLDKYVKTDPKKTYQDCLVDACQNGLKLYARKLAWSNDENIVDCISSKIIFDEILNNFLQKSELIDLKEVLYLNPLTIELIRKLIRFSNERLNQISLQDRKQFINIHTTFIKNLWINYFQNLKLNFENEKSYDQNEDKYHFYSDCYLNILEFSFISQLEIQVKLEKEGICEIDSLIEVKINGEIVFSRISLESNDVIYVIVFDEINRNIKFEQIFSFNNQLKETDRLQNFIENKINTNEIFLVIIPFKITVYLTEDIKSFFKKLGSTIINYSDNNMNKIFIKRKNTNEIYEKQISKNKQLFIKKNFRLNSNEDIIITEQNINIEQIETIIYNAMIFTLKYFKPWEKLQIKQWLNYFNQSIDENISTKEIADRLLIKIIKDGKNYVLEIFKNNNNNDSFSNQLESMISYYQKSLVENKNLNCQSKIKEIKKVFLYFLQISENEIFSFEDIKNIQLETIKYFIEAKQSITEIIEHFLTFNKEFLKLSQKFEKYFSYRKHKEFNENCRKIISLLTEIFQIILYDDNSLSELLKQYETSNLEDALQKSILQKKLDDIKVLLLDFNVNINQIDLNSKKSLLDLAIEKNDEDLILFLLEKGFEIDIKKYKKSKIDLNSLLNKIKNKPKENLSRFKNKLFAMQKMINFLTNLGSLDLSWFIEKTQIKNFDENIFKKIGENDIYQILDIEKGKVHVKDSCPHYLLKILIELLEIIRDFNIIDNIKQIEMTKLRAELIMAIEKSFNYFKDQIKYNSLSSFKNDCIKPFKDMTENNQSYYNFFEQLQKLDLFFLYTRKLKEITVDQALKLFREENENSFNFEKIKNSFTEYDKLFQEYFSNILNKKKSIEDIIKETKKIANESNFNRNNIPSIIAGLSIILSLTVSDFIEKNYKGEYILKNKFNKDYLLQPHCIQILGVFIILDIDGNTNFIPQNHLAQILTGQGKSWALALLAGYFSLIGYNVTVGCYSNYLSQRDEEDFKKNFDAFNFINEIKYKTFEKMCN